MKTMVTSQSVVDRIARWRKVVKAREKRMIDHEVERLRQDAGQAGDMKQVRLCDKALQGNRKARLACAEVLADYELR
jgi:hypothetical protein